MGGIKRPCIELASRVHSLHSRPCIMHGQCRVILHKKPQSNHSNVLLMQAMQDIYKQNKYRDNREYRRDGVNSEPFFFQERYCMHTCIDGFKSNIKELRNEKKTYL